MINFFQLAPNDQSLVYLGMIFGQVGTIINGTTPSLMSTMFKTFNSMMLVVAVIIVIYTVIVGLIATASEGEFLGKKFHGIWTPIRIVLGIAALVPTPTGYCSLQIIMMWVLVQGIGAADYLWTTALKYIQTMGSPYTAPNTPSVGAASTLGQVFQGITCAATARTSDTSIDWHIKDNPFKGYYCVDNPGGCNTPGTSKCNGTSCQMSFGPGGSCGTLSICDPTAACANSSSVACAACRAQAQVILPLLMELAKKAASFAQADANYVKFYKNSGSAPEGQDWGWISTFCSDNGITPCCVKTQGSTTCKNEGGEGVFPKPFANKDAPTDASSQEVLNVIKPYFKGGIGGDFSEDFITKLAKQYSDAIDAAVKPIIDQLQTSMQNTQFAGKLQEAQNFGWVFAGAYYYFIAQQNNSNLAGANPPFTYSGGSPSSDQSNALYNYRNNYNAAGALLGSMAGGAPASSPHVGAMNAALFSTIGGSGGILDSFMKTVSGGSGSTVTTTIVTDPVARIQSLGEGILLACEILWAVVMVLIIVMGAIGAAGSLTILGTGAPIYSAINIINTWLTPMILGFMVAFMSIGGVLAVYVPLIPYVIFIMGVIGWFGSTIEVMVAAPLVALGILSPSAQHHELLGKAESGLMLMFTIFLRPSLMIFGLFAGMLLSVVAITIINSTFAAVMASITSSHFGGGGTNTTQGSGQADILELIFFMVAYVFLVVSALNKCFSMIHVIPERVMRWIGGQGDQYGEGEGLQEMKGGVSGAGGQAAGAAAGGAKTVGDQTKGDFDKRTKEQQDAGGTAPSVEGSSSGGSKGADDKTSTGSTTNNKPGE